MNPLLTGAAADRARDVVAAVADALRDPAVHDDDPGLRFADVSRGSAGAALLFAELAQDGDEAAAETALAFLDASLDAAAQDERPSALLYAGTVGVGWTLAYLGGRLVDADPEENDVDLLADRALTSSSWPSVDLIRGVAGVGVYLVERGRSTDPMVERLAALSTPTDRGVTWWVDPMTCLPERREAFPDGYYDVGMAHGQAGVMAVLAHALAAGNENARPLLESATEWLLAQRLPHGPGRYPTIIPADERPAGGGRLAWCYGDAGVAAGLLAAGRALGDDTIVKEAADLALDAASRRGEDAVVLDAPICHGSAGLLHVFHRLYRQLDDERLADAARFWAEHALAQQRTGEPVAGYGSIRPEGDEHVYHPQAGLLEGAAGIALVLNAATSERAPDWDALIMTKPVE